MDHLARRLFSIDTRALAAFRIALALLVCWDVLDRSRFLDDFWGPDGMYPRAAQAPPYSTVRFSLYSLSESLGYQAALLLLTGLAAAALLAGWRTGWAAALACLLVWSLHTRGPTMLDVGDYVIWYLLLWGAFLPLGARWSMDAAPRGPGPSLVCSVASAGILLQVAISYACAGWTKLGSEYWLTGRAVEIALAGDTWVTPTGAWLYRHPSLTEGLNWGALVVEGVVPLLLFWPSRMSGVRMGAAAVLLGFAVSLGLAIQLGLIPFAMSLGLVLFVPSHVWDRITPGAPPVPVSTPAPVRLHTAAALFLLMAMLGTNAYHLAARRALPRPLEVALGAIRWDQQWSMYDPPYLANFRLAFQGVTRGGGRREIAIGARRPNWPPTEEWPITERLWRNYRARMYLYDYVGGRAPSADVGRVAEWFARRWDRAHAPQERWQLLELVKEVRRPWTPAELGRGAGALQPLAGAVPLIRVAPEQP